VAKLAAHRFTLLRNAKAYQQKPMNPVLHFDRKYRNFISHETKYTHSFIVDLLCHYDKN